MGNLIETVLCSLGCVYLVMHVAYGMISASENIKHRKVQKDEPAAPRSNDGIIERPDPVGAK